MRPHRHSAGGGVYVANGSAEIERVLVFNCNASLGSAFSFWGSTVSILGALIVGNQAENGAAFYLNGGEVEMDHLTVGFDNANPSNATAIFSSGCNVDIKNSIFLEDGDAQADLMIFHHGTVGIDFNDILGGNADIVNDQATLTWGDGNIDADPMFIDPDEGDFTLSPDSPCIDAGSPESPEDPDGSLTDVGMFCFYQRDMTLDSHWLEFPATEPGLSVDMTITVTNIGMTPLWMELPMVEPAEAPSSPQPRWTVPTTSIPLCRSSSR